MSDDPRLEQAERLLARAHELGAGDRAAEAAAAAREALSLREAALGPSHPEVAAAALDLAGTLLAAHDLDEAVATALSNLASLQRSRGDAAGAAPLFERALAIREAALGAAHPAVASALHNLADLSQEMGDLDRAEPLYERALRIREAALGPEHPSVAISLQNLGGLCRERGDLRRAEALLRRAVDILAAAFGPNHPASTQAKASLMTLYGVGEAS
jgi:tetratricopeptide (TPR) repeat protein